MTEKRTFCYRQVQPKTASQARQIIKETKGVPVILKFFTHWCQACAESKKPVQDAANDVCDGARVIEVDADFNEDFANELQVEGFPTMVAFMNGQRVGTFDGVGTRAEYKDFYSKWSKKFNG